MSTINCPGTCAANFAPGTTVNLTATPAEGSVFTAWSGDVPAGHETDNPVVVTVSADMTVNAEFTAAPPPPPPDITFSWTATETWGAGVIFAKLPASSPSFVGNIGEHSQASSASFNITMPGSPTMLSGDTIVICSARATNSAILSITDSAGNTYEKANFFGGGAPIYHAGGGGVQMYMSVGANALSPGDLITITLVAGGSADVVVTASLIRGVTRGANPHLPNFTANTSGPADAADPITMSTTDGDWDGGAPSAGDFVIIAYGDANLGADVGVVPASVTLRDSKGLTEIYVALYTTVYPPA